MINQLTNAINFISSKDVDEERVMQSKSDNIGFKPYDNANGVVNELFESLPNWFRNINEREWFYFQFS